MSFTFEMEIWKGVLAIDIYNFIRAKQNDIDGAVLICIVMQSCSREYTRASNTFNNEILGRCKYMPITVNVAVYPRFATGPEPELPRELSFGTGVGKP